MATYPQVCTLEYGCSVEQADEHRQHVQSPPDLQTCFYQSNKVCCNIALNETSSADPAWCRTCADSQCTLGNTRLVL
jgi:hypothetical protein